MSSARSTYTVTGTFAKDEVLLAENLPLVLRERGKYFLHREGFELLRRNGLGKALDNRGDRVMHRRVIAHMGLGQARHKK
jgi:hypothetical protein